MLNGDVEKSIVTSQAGHTDITTSYNYYYYNNKTIDYIANQVANAINY